MPVLPNGGFETGDLTSWTVSTPTVNVSVTSLFPHQGSWAAMMTALPGTTTTLSTTTTGAFGAATYTVGFSLLWYVDYRQAHTFTLYATWVGGGPSPAVVGAITLPVVANWGLDQYTTYTSSTCLMGAASTLTLACELDGGSQGVRILLDDVSVFPVLLPS